jgi:hypothetical protein
MTFDSFWLALHAAFVAVTKPGAAVAGARPDRGGGSGTAFSDLGLRLRARRSQMRAFSGTMP